MATLAPDRADLLRGDLRILYLGWLLRAQSGELEDDDVEPFIPPGLAKLSAPLQGLVDFLGIDDDLIALAAEASDSSPPSSTGEGFVAWVTALPSAEKDALLLSFCEGRDAMAGVRLRRRFEAEQPKQASAAGRRTMRQLLDGAARVSEKREQKEAELAAKVRAREIAKAADLRAKHLGELAAREPEAWRKVVQLISLKTPKGYDEAVALLLDLRDLAARSDGASRFNSQLNAVRGDHASKPSFMGRLRKAGL
jgi:hypothetical protein